MRDRQTYGTLESPMFTIPYLLATAVFTFTWQIPIHPRATRVQVGLATVYWPGDGHSGKVCADGKPFTKERCHIAHRSWPMGSKVRVCSKKTRRCTITYIGDRGPFGACDDKGLRENFACRGRWTVKIHRRDPGTWRGIADLSKCVWRKIGGPGLQVIQLELLKR